MFDFTVAGISNARAQLTLLGITKRASISALTAMACRSCVGVLVVLLLALSVFTNAAPVNPLRSIKHWKTAIDYDHDVNLSVSPNYINQSSSSAWVKVTWSGISHPHKHDWIGVWLLPDGSSTIDPKHHAPAKFQDCSYNDSYLDTGAGQLSLQLINMRGVFQLALLTDKDEPTLVAVSEKVTFSNPNVPQQVHLALTHIFSNIKIVWDSKESVISYVKYGLTSGHYDFTKQADSSGYSANDMCDSPAKDLGWIEPGVIYTAVMDNLNPATTYYYKVGSYGNGGWSDEYTFVSPPVPGPDKVTTVLAYGDMGHGEADMSSENKHYQQPSLNTTKNLLQDKGDFIMHIGDLSYAEGYGASWEEFFFQVQPLMTKYPYMVNPGNHESDSPNSDALFQGDDSGGECNIPYIKKFAMPRQGPQTPWYNFMYGSIHVIMMSTEHDFQTSSTQYADLVGFLENVNRTRTPWLVFSGHRPMYVSAVPSDSKDSHSTVAKLLRKNIEPLLIKYQVDLALWGHCHSYQRTCPVNDGVCADGAPVHVVIGMGGQKLTKHLNPDQPEYFKFVDNTHYGYTKFTTNSTALEFQFVLNVDGTVADSWTILK